MNILTKNNEKIEFYINENLDIDYIDDEAIILNPESEKIIALNKTATLILNYIMDVEKNNDVNFTITPSEVLKLFGEYDIEENDYKFLNDIDILLYTLFSEKVIIAR